ncbi:MAG: HIT family protein, partial [Kiritimatiellia bacterium]
PMPTLFTKIISGEIPSARLYEDDDFYAFLDIRPIHAGHALLIPKQEIDYIFDLPDDLLQKMLTTARPIARAIEEHVPCKKIGLIVAGLEVPHCHLHLVPIHAVSDLDFSKASAAEPDDLQALAAKIRTTLSNTL